MLEFEIFHQSTGYGETELDLEESNHLIGVAFVPLAGLIQGRGKTRLTGLFDVVAKKAIYSSIDGKPDPAASDALGKIKISVTADKNPNILLSAPGDADEDFQHVTPALMRAELDGKVGQNNIREKFSFGMNNKPADSGLAQSYAYNAYPSAPYSESFMKVDQNIRHYHQNLTQIKGDEIDQIHRDNMSQLDELQSQLSKSLAVLDVQENVSPEVSPKKQDFRATVKTDAAMATMHADLRKRKPAEGGVDNPFASRNYEAGLLRADADLDERQPETRVEAEPIAEADDAGKDSPEFQLNVDSEAEFQARLAAQEAEEEEPPAIALPEIDLDEMERMDKIMRGEK